jgi:Gram-negative bacterial TonB protein C-terminal
VRKEMADSARIDQATVLEIPVTIQGSRIVEGTERRELFTETTKTTLIFENGAVLNLKSRVLPGQCVFLRNDQSGRELLCKVLESPQGGQTGYTDLEFTVYDPEFWSVRAEQPAAAGQKPEAQKGIEAAGESSVDTPRMESSSPASGQIPATSPETAMTGLTCPSPETTEALPESSNAAECHDAKSTDLLAALIARDTRSKAHRDPPAKGTKETERELAFEDVPEQGETSSDTASEAGVFSRQESWARRMPKFTAGKNPIAVGIAASVLITATLGVAWHAKHGPSIRSSNRPSAASAQSRQHALPAPAQLSQPPASAVATGGPTTAGALLTNTGNTSAGTEVHARGNNAGTTPVQAAQKFQQPTEAQEAGVAVAQNPTATTAGVGAARGSKAVEDSAPSVVPKVEASRSMLSSDQTGLGQPIHRESNELNTGETIPPRIVSQSLPFLPPWAKGLDMDGVVQLDALIDEGGNVAETKPVSGPRVLQRAAERAVALWIFEPALADGKPTAARMLLTVQFQK